MCTYFYHVIAARLGGLASNVNSLAGFGGKVDGGKLMGVLYYCGKVDGCPLLLSRGGLILG
jgi:hypothetical protein